MSISGITLLSMIPLTDSCRINGINHSYRKSNLSTYSDIVNKNFSEPSRKHVPSLFVTPITNGGHQILALEPPPYSIVNTLGFTPVSL